MKSKNELIKRDFLSELMRESVEVRSRLKEYRDVIARYEEKLNHRDGETTELISVVRSLSGRISALEQARHGAPPTKSNLRILDKL